MNMSQPARLVMRNTEAPVMKYYDDGGKSGRGNCTWGIGIKAHDGPCSKAELARAVTASDVEREFATRVLAAERGVERNVKVELTQAQFDALVSLTFNVGVRGASKVYDLLNQGDTSGAARYIANMTTARQKRNGKNVQVTLKGLVTRRMAESAPFRSQIAVGSASE
jgi:GH24 family phage-related lysozyme (muramidase)